MEYDTGFFRPKKSLGQSFLINGNVAVAEAVHGEGKNVLELGPGRGILTRELCSRAKKVVAVELDRKLYALLKLNLIPKFDESRADKQGLLQGDEG